MAEPEPEAAAAEWVDGSGLAAEEVAEQLIGRQVDIEGVDPPAIGDAGIAITNGVVYLATERGAFAEAVGIRGDSIVAVHGTGEG